MSGMNTEMLAMISATPSVIMKLVSQTKKIIGVEGDGASAYVHI